MLSPEPDLIVDMFIEDKDFRHQLLVHNLSFVLRRDEIVATSATVIDRLVLRCSKVHGGKLFEVTTESLAWFTDFVLSV